MNKLFLIDCMEYMKSREDNTFDLAIVDPPYGIPKRGTDGSGKLVNRILNQDNISRWDIKPNLKYFIELFRISKNQIIWGGNYFELPGTRGFIVWDKKQPFPNFSRCEYAWISFQVPSKIFEFDNRTGDKIHPTQKPVALYKWLLQNYAKPGDKLFDSHSGSGSFRIAAWDLGFDLVSCEIDSDYYRDNEARFQNHIKQSELFEKSEYQDIIYDR